MVRCSEICLQEKGRPFQGVPSCEVDSGFSADRLVDLFGEGTRGSPVPRAHVSSIRSAVSKRHEKACRIPCTVQVYISSSIG